MASLILKGKAYDAVKYTVLIAIPAFSTAYVMLDAALANVGGVPYVDEVVKTLAVVAFLLGALTGISKVRYDNSEERFDGTAFVDRGDPTNNPDVMLKQPVVQDPGKVLTLKVQETEPASPAPKEPLPPVA